MNSLEDVKTYVHENAALSRPELEVLLMRRYHLKRAEAREVLDELGQELNSGDPLPEQPGSLLGVLATIETQQPPSVVSGVAAMIDATVREFERDTHLEREERGRSGQPRRSHR
jgi:hypothetical protein